MNNIKYGILAFGVLGLIGCFLPMISEEGMSISLFKLREADAGMVYIVMAGFAAAAVMGGLALKGLLRWQAIVATVGFALVLIKFRDGLPTDIFKGAIGSKLMGLSMIGGVICSIIGIAKPEGTKA
jgi:hypothetical protein